MIATVSTGASRCEKQDWRGAKAVLSTAVALPSSVVEHQLPLHKESLTSCTIAQENFTLETVSFP